MQSFVNICILKLANMNVICLQIPTASFKKCVVVLRYEDVRAYMFVYVCMFVCVFTIIYL